MTYRELFLAIKYGQYKTAGLDVQYKIELDEPSKKIYLLFQSSQSKTDWKINFTFPAKVYKRQKNKFLVHYGYVKAWRSCNDTIIKELESVFIKHPDYTIVVSGWSYGGAISVLAAEDIRFRLGIKPELITYGAPKILYFNFTKKYFLSCVSFCVQFAQYNDLVPHLPPAFYIHHINKMEIGEELKIKELLFNSGYYHCNYENCFITK